MRNEMDQDTRPNKALELPSHHHAWASYRHKDRWQGIVAHGVVPTWEREPPRQPRPPKNHASATKALNVIVKNLRKSQDADHIIVLDLALLPTLQGVFCSPFGAVEKGDVSIDVDARMIHDLSHPAGGSINDYTASGNTIPMHYDGAKAIAERFIQPEELFPNQTEMMTGDVTGAFKHIPLHANHVGRFAGTIPELGVLIIDLTCPFGWKDSPGHYWVAGEGINHLHASSGPRWQGQPTNARQNFDGKAWCDDHNCIESNIGSRLAEAELSLRQAMVDFLGPDSCNEEKFTSWFRTGKSLGLLWDIENLSISMPEAKIAKAVKRVNC